MKASLSAADLASLLGVSERTLRRMEAAGTGPPRRVENLTPCYPVESLVVWLRENRPDVKLGTAAEMSDKASRLALLEAWESRLCDRYGLENTEVMYAALRHANFHQTGVARQPDAIEHWNLAAYAVFSGTIVAHRLAPEQLRDLLNDFENCRDYGLAAKQDLSPREFAEEIQEALTEQAFEVVNGGDGVSLQRQTRDYIAITHRYCCAVVGEYRPPPGNLNIMKDLAELDRRGADERR